MLSLHYLELRLVVYEFLPNQTDRTEFVKIVKDGPDSSFALITSSAPTDILDTCRIIRDKASGIMHATAQQVLQSIGLAGLGPRIEADCDALEALPGNMHLDTQKSGTFTSDSGTAVNGFDGCGCNEDKTYLRQKSEITAKDKFLNIMQASPLPHPHMAGS
jgi:hypothetical protein